MGINVDAEKKAYKRFIKEGMTAFGACGLIGNLEAESDGFYANRVEYLCLSRLKANGQIYTDTTYTAAIDDGKITLSTFQHPLQNKQYGYGLAQWTSPGRKEKLWKFWKNYAGSIGDAGMQLEFLLKELSESYPAVLKVLKNATSIREASDIVLKKFEIPANTGESVCAARAQRGQNFYDNYVKKEGASVSTVRMSNCGQDENGEYSGGRAGDQSGKEWYLRSWYSYPWNYILRWKDESLGSLFADLAIEAANNDLIGYDQNERGTFWTHLKASGYHPKNITIACETDCSSGTIALIKAVGYLKGISVLQNCGATYTGNMMAYFQGVGKSYFDVLTGKYLTDSAYAKKGDINLNVQHHVNITVDNGSKAENSSTGATSSGYLQKGDSGDAVKTMQTMLIACGYTCGSAGADGQFGSSTESALKKFQTANNLEVDGIYGSASKSALEKAYTQKTSVTTSESAESFDKSIAGTYKTTDSLYLRSGAGTGKHAIMVIPAGASVQNYGYYTEVDGVKWMYITYHDKIGFCSGEYLCK